MMSGRKSDASIAFSVTDNLSQSIVGMKNSVNSFRADVTGLQEGCATPVDALKKLLRMGEVEKLCRVIDQLNGYGPGSVTVLSGKELEGAAIGAALEELEKNGPAAQI